MKILDAVPVTGVAVSQGRIAVGIVVHSDALSEPHRRLVDALCLRADVSKVWVGLLPARRRGPNALIGRWSAALDAFLARGRRNPLLASELADPGSGRVQVVPVEPRHLADLMRPEGLTWLIDLRGAPPAQALVSACQHGVLLVASDQRLDDLRFRRAGLRKLVPEQLALLHWVVGQEGPRTLHSCLHAPSGGHLNHDRSLLAGRSISFICRVLDGAPERANDASAPRTLIGQPSSSWPEALRSISAAGQAVADRLRWRWSAPDQWFLATNVSPDSFLTRGHALRSERWLKLPNDGQHFYADPILIEHEGRTHVFFEDYPYQSRRGLIAHALLTEDGQLTPPKVVLERPYHLSYPFVFTHGGEIYMVPETSANRTVELYRAEPFPQRWTLVKTLLEDVNAVDATLHHDGQRWWMFVNMGEHGSSTNDELHLFHALEPTGPWQAHQHNPVRTGLTGTRPAGPLFHDGEQWIRPAQDCALLYGGGLVFNAIRRLDLDGFEEVAVRRIAPQELGRCDGLHTISASSRHEIIDARRAGT